ncbi:MAG: hypothetical protein QM813_27045 [Verrucomicrobiota bacterium]
MSRLLGFSICLLCLAACNPRQHRQTLADLAPSGFVVLDSTAGHLNGDTLQDLILVLKNPHEDSISQAGDTTVQRPLLIFLRQPDGTLQLSARSDNAVYCISCGGVMGDPFQGISILGNKFSVLHYGGSALRWSRTITFIYNDGAWWLHDDALQSFDVDDNDDGIIEHQHAEDYDKQSFLAFDIYR